MKKNIVFKNTLIYIVLTVIALVVLFPMLWAVSASLRSDVELYQYISPLSIKTFLPVEFTLEAYKMIFTQFGFGEALFNSFFVSIMSIILGSIINSIAALAFALFEFKGKNLIFSIIVITFMIPFEAIALPLYKVAFNLNILNTLEGIYLPGVANGLVLFLFVQFFKDIPKGLLEAAVIDGAKWRTIFVKIIIPLTTPVFITAGLVLFISQWNAYLWPLLVAQSKELRVIQIKLGEFKTEESTLWSCIYAGSVLSALIPLGLFLPFQKYYVSGITSGGIKG